MSPHFPSSKISFYNRCTNKFGLRSKICSGFVPCNYNRPLMMLRERNVYTQFSLSRWGGVSQYTPAQREGLHRGICVYQYTPGQRVRVPYHAPGWGVDREYGQSRL